MLATCTDVAGRVRLETNGSELAVHSCPLASASWTADQGGLVCREGSSATARLLATSDGVVLDRPLATGPAIYVVRRARDVVITDEPSELLKLRLIAETSRLVHFLAFGDLIPPLTPWKDTISVPPGGRVHIGPGLRIIVDRRITRLPNDAPPLLRAARDALSSRFRGCTCKVAVELSGGLDSAAVSIAAQDALGSDRICLVHLHHATPRAADELTHAKRVAEELNLPLTTVDGSALLPFSDLSAPHVGQPSSQLCNLALHRGIRAAGDHAHHVDGHGGDQLFYADVRRPILVRAVAKSEGLRAGPREASAFAERHARSYLTTALACWTASTGRRADLLNDALGPWNAPRRLGRQRMRDRQRRALFDRQRRASPEHLRTAEIRTAIAAAPGLLRTPPLFHPFLQESVIAAACATESSAFLQGGHDRAQLRKEVAAHLTSDIAYRREKSDYSGTFVEGAARNYDQLRDLIRSGELARRHLLVPHKAEAGIERLALGDTSCLWGMVHLIALELWLQGISRG